MEHQLSRFVLAPHLVLILVCETDMPMLFVPFRHANLQLLQQYGGNAWKVHNYLLEADAKAVEADLEVLKNRVTEVNRDRKNSQVSLNHCVVSSWSASGRSLY